MKKRRRLVICAWCYEPIKTHQAWVRFVKDYIHVWCIDEVIKRLEEVKQEEGFITSTKGN
jgi:hypothetical protein